ncbi:hypothetical protein GUITHDRAFT_144180 [Guillardia theta CCMP2712]|uniref:HTH CENPB-type domain-containing protein n=1 Tax=Guillardia theta (strain CCMP2712) TaxID=905079 RepID=L1IR60_GUITC|nr:hypothetical protein GUITHDRAFT_144180 [Guillardia theta CCMP2712]EKX38587.1 hypothetical protein GUITHDRAFT_144180 [Guillardia theta CCMP2712]|eukprot:XP_005825567.1 hypothetical protein GUITHDRAFT_144180 [Guillardia theta CCMP2712]
MPPPHQFMRADWHAAGLHAAAPMPPPPKPLPPLAEDQSTVGLMLWPNMEGKLTITGIKEDKSAAQTELQIGDVVAKIDDDSVEGLDATLVAAKLIGPTGSTVTLTTGGGTTVTLTRDVSAEEANKKIDRRRREKEKRISLGERLEVALKLESKEITAKEAMDMLGCCRSYISQMMKPNYLNKLKKARDLGLDLKLTKAHLPKFPAIEDELHKWLKDLAAANPHLRPPMTMSSTMEKAQELAVLKSVTDFKANNIWFASFVKRYGLDTIGYSTDVQKPASTMTATAKYDGVSTAVPVYGN